MIFQYTNYQTLHAQIWWVFIHELVWWMSISSLKAKSSKMKKTAKQLLEYF
jgi:hypothetical protein